MNGCSNTLNGGTIRYYFNNLFGKFSYAWEGHCDVDSTARLKDWLDPVNTGQTTLDGRAACRHLLCICNAERWHGAHAKDDDTTVMIL